MDLADVERLNAHWAKHPPVKVLIRSYLGVYEKPAAPCTSIDGLMAALGEG